MRRRTSHSWRSKKPSSWHFSAWILIVPLDGLKADKTPVTDMGPNAPNRLDRIYVCIVFDLLYDVLWDISAVLQWHVRRAVEAVVECMLETIANGSHYLRRLVSSLRVSATRPTLLLTEWTRGWPASSFIASLRLSISMLRWLWPWATGLARFRRLRWSEPSRWAFLLSSSFCSRSSPVLA